VDFFLSLHLVDFVSMLQLVAFVTSLHRVYFVWHLHLVDCLPLVYLVDGEELFSRVVRFGRAGLQVDRRQFLKGGESPFTSGQVRLT